MAAQPILDRLSLIGFNSVETAVTKESFIDTVPKEFLEDYHDVLEMRSGR